MEKGDYGDVKFWRMFVDQFDSPKAFQLVVEALLERGDRVASMALMLQWVSQVEYTPLEDGDASFHPLLRDGRCRSGFPSATYSQRRSRGPVAAGGQAWALLRITKDYQRERRPSSFVLPSVAGRSERKTTVTERQ